MVGTGHAGPPPTRLVRAATTGDLTRLHVEVAGQRTNSADEVIARLVDYGPVSLSLLVWATMIAVVPYPAGLRWGFVGLVGAYMLVYQYLVARDLRPSRAFTSVSLRWFLLGFLAGVAGFFGATWGNDWFGALALERWGTWSLLPFQFALALMLFQTLQGVRGRHSLLVSMIGILTTALSIAACHLLFFGDAALVLSKLL